MNSDNLTLMRISILFALVQFFQTIFPMNSWFVPSDVMLHQKNTRLVFIFIAFVLLLV